MLSFHREYRSTHKEEFSERDKVYNINNSEKIKSQRKKYRELNSDEIKKNKKYFYESNKDKILEKQLQYRKTDEYIKRNIEYRKSEIGKILSLNSKHKRRSIEKKGGVTSREFMSIKKEAKNCYWCNISLKGKDTHIDHYTPLSKGGTHEVSNLVTSCSNCNLKKHAKDPIIFANSIGKLL
jgi:5-methylcytosine-specific restriction endonuclease McrA